MIYINDNFGLKNGGYSNYESTIALPRHRWYYYKEGFSPNLVEKAIEYAEIGKEGIIIDPFNGSGTTTLTSALKGYKSIGIEVNPFTAFLSESKIKNVDKGYFLRNQQRILDGAERGAKSPLKKFSTFSKTDSINKWLFNDDVLDTFSGGWLASDIMKNPDEKQVLQLALIVSAMQNCNAKRDGKCLRYRDSWQNNLYNKDTFLSDLHTNLSIILEDIEQFPISESPTIITGDVRHVLNDNRVEKFNLCITSPPYLNTFDYTDIYRPELFLGQFVKSQDELYNLRLKTIRSHIQAQWENPVISHFGELYYNSMKYVLEHKSDLMHKKIPLMIQAYFEDMLNILKQLKNKAEKNAQLWMVVSNSAYADKEIPVDLIIAEMACLANWKLKEVGALRDIKRRKTKHSPNVSTLRESVIILKNGK